MHLIEHGFLYDDCAICKHGDREGIHWVDTERTFVTNGNRHRVLLCSSCIGDSIRALSVLIPEESDVLEDEGTADGSAGAAEYEADGSTHTAPNGAPSTTG